jgi:phenylalanyl-tRNA synthetase beta chain
VPGEQGLVQEPMLGMLLLGRAQPERWCHPREATDFYHLKGDIESLFALGRNSERLAFAAAQRAALHPGRCADILLDGAVVGYLGALHPQTQSALDLEQPVYVAELVQSALCSARMPVFSAVSRYPEVRRDLALIVDRTLPAAVLLQAVREQAGPYCTDLTLFDVYEGKGIDPKRKSIALGLTFRDQSRTLADEEVSAAVSQVVDSLKKNYNAELRS